MPLAEGSSLGPYRIIAAIGAGGMGEVYRARDPRLGRDVAVKVVGEAVSGSAEGIARFEREARAVAALSHPNILSIFDIGEDGGRYYFITELLEGESLRARIRRGAIPPDEAVPVARQILAALAAAHAAGIVHRDVKPENIFLTNAGPVKMLDFGIAVMAHSDSSPEDRTSKFVLTGTGLAIGTPSYMAPEQLAGERVDARADVFAFGCVLYEMLTGRKAFEGNTAMSTAARILNEPADLSAVPAEFRELLARCLAKAPASRYADASEVLAAIAAPRNDVPQRAEGRTRPKWVVPVSAIAVLVLVVIGAFAWRMHGGATSSPIDSIAVLPLANLSGDPAQQYFADGMTDVLIAELSQVASLKVISRTSVMQYAGAKKALPLIARELGVRGIVEGSVMRAGNRVRITADLVDGETDRHLWTKNYERDVSDVITMQREIATAVAKEIRAAVTPREVARLATKTAVNPAALEACLRARAEWNRRTRESLLSAETLYRAAIAADPSYAAAWAGLADTEAILADNGFVPAAAVKQSATDAARKALELDPQSAEAHASLGLIFSDLDFDWQTAERELRTALELKPSYANAQQWLGALLFTTNRKDEALAHLDRAVALDPLAPRIRTVRAGYYFFAGDPSTALAAAQANFDSDSAMAHLIASDVYVSRGDAARAMNEARQCCHGGTRRKAQVAYVEASAGRRSEALSELAEMRDETYEAPYQFAKAYVAAGDLDSAFDVIFKNPVVVLDIAFHPSLASLRRDPRWRRALDSVKLTAYYPQR